MPVILALVMTADSTALTALVVQPRAAVDAVMGERDGAILVRLRAAPVDGQANAALVRFLARILRVPQGDVELVRGATGRRKWIRVAAFSAEAVRSALLASV